MKRVRLGVGSENCPLALRYEIALLARGRIPHNKENPAGMRGLQNGDIQVAGFG